MYISMTSYQISNLSEPSITLDVCLNRCATILHNITEDYCNSNLHTFCMFLVSVPWSLKKHVSVTKLE